MGKCRHEWRAFLSIHECPKCGRFSSGACPVVGKDAPYSSEIAAAWLVVDKILAGQHAEEFAWRLLSKHKTDAELILAVLRSLTPKTICELALIAYGVPLPEEEE